MKKTVPFLAIICVFVGMLMLRTGLQNEEGVSYNEKDGKDSPMDGIREYARYEFDLLKDPRTGRIPEGIHDAEWAVAMNMPVRTEKTNTGYTWAFRGPNNLGGRTRAIAFDVRNANIILSGCVSGGIMRSADGGLTWTRVSPSAQIHNVTSIAQDTRVGFQDTWYAATGEALGNSTSEDGAFYLGHGIYKSVDNGVTWVRLANSNTGALEAFDNCNDLISKVIVNPTNGDVYMASLRQIMRSQNGGTTWAQVIGSGCASSGDMTDIVCTSGGRLYCAFSGSVPNTLDGVWTSTTGNAASWTRIAGTGAGVAGWDAQGSYGRVVLALAPSNQNILYALYDNFDNSACPATVREADFFRWNQGTTTWTDRSGTLPDEAGCLDGNDPFAVQGGYDLVVAVKPNDENTVFIGGTNAYRSADAGLTWTRIGGYNTPASFAKYASHHPDLHAMVFAPGDNNNLYTGDDGGIQRGDITAGSVVWTPLNSTYNTYQYYHVAMHPGSGINDVIGGAQDNGTTTGIGGAVNYTEIMTGDGCAVGIGSGAAPYKQYVSVQNGIIRRRNSGQAPGVSEATLTPAGVASIFVTYFYLNPDNTEDLYYAGQIAGNNRILRITNASTATAASWTTLTFNYNGYVRAMAATRGAYAATHRLYLGTDGGRLYRLTDPRNCAVGTAPTDITPTGMAGLGTIVGIAVHPTNHDEIMVVYSNYGVNSIWHTTNAGAASPTWTNVEGNLSLPSIRSCAIVENAGTTEYVVGTSIGVYATATLSGGATVWAQEGAALMNFAVATSMAYRPVDRVLLVGTHGNGMFMTTLSGPVGLQVTDLTGKRIGNDVELTWRAPGAGNVTVFQVQRSTDGVTFVSAGAVPPTGSVGIVSTYGYTDESPTSGKVYYRIAQLESGGQVFYTNIIELNLNPYANLSVSLVYPNPVSDVLSVSIEMPARDEVTFALYDLQGRTLITRSMVLGEGNRTVTFDAEALPAGSYYLNIRTLGQTILRNVIKH